MQFDKLLNLIGRLDEEGKNRFEMVLSSFLGEAIVSEDVDFEDEALELEDFKNDVGEEIFRPLFMSGVEFFLSNEYPSHSFHDLSSWNAIDFLLKKRGLLLPAQDVMYLKGLRDSYMSLYEVIDVKLNQSITLRNLLEDNQPPQVIQEKRGTHSLCQWDLLGARLVKMPQSTVLAGGFFLLDRETLEAAKENIQKITKIMMNKKNLQLFQEETKDPVLMIKKMWVKEIAQNWFMDMMAKREGPIYLNFDGDPLEFYTIEFPLKGSVSDGVKKINTLPELAHHEIEETPHAWIWPLEEKKTRDHPVQETTGEKHRKVIVLDSQLIDQEGSCCRYQADIRLKGKTLFIDVNSEKRATRIQDFFQTHLGLLLGSPTRIQHDLNRSSDKTASSNKVTSGLSSKEEEKLIQQMFDRHYREWTDTPLSFLNDKTPRQAVKTKKGLSAVIGLIKDMQNADNRAVKCGNKQKPYSFDWLFAELGIERNLL